MPDGHASEVGAVGIGIADTRHNGEAPGLEHPASTLHRGMKANPLGDGDEPFHRQCQRFAISGVSFILERDDRVDSVIAAVELNHDEHPAVFLRRGGTSRPREEAGNARGERNQREGAQNIASCDHRILRFR